MRLTDFVLDYLVKFGVKTVFVINGSAIAESIDAFTRNENIKSICSVHEQGAAFAAETLTKVSRSLGVAMATSGPGGTNLLTGVANCWYDSIPCLFITGQVNTAFLSKGTPVRQVGFQEIDIVRMAEPITKYAAMVRDPNAIRWTLDKAIFEATTGRPGPVLIDLPMDIQKASVDVSSLEGFSGEVPDYGMDDMDSKIDLFLDMLEKSERPILLGGGGIRLSDAIDDVLALGNVLKIPCVPTWNALDIFASDFEYYRGRVGTYGGPGRNFAIQNTDLLLSIGSRISGRITGGVVGSFAREATKFIVDIDRAALDPDFQQVKGDVNVYCDAKVFIRRLTERAKSGKLKRFNVWLNLTKEWRDGYDPVLPEYYQLDKFVNPYVFIEKLSYYCKPEDVIVADCGGNVVVTNQAFKTKIGQRLCSSNGNSPMGYSFAGAIGACFANVKGNVICLIGDGGFTMNIQELQTVKNYDLPLKTFIMNNHVYGIIKAYQDTNLCGRYEASGPKGYNPPDFLKIVEGYGIATEEINDHSELDKKIGIVLDHKGPIVCDVNMHENYTYEPRIFGWNTPIEDMYPYLPRDEFRKNMLIEPITGWENPVMPQDSRQQSENP